MLKHHHTGGRLQNYYATPVRYTVSGGVFDDPQWGARLAGILYMVMGGVLMITPLIKSLGIAAQIALGIFGAAAFMTTTLSFPVALAIAAVLMIVGAGVVAGFRPAYFPAMVLAFVLFMLSFPLGTAVGCVLLYVLWRGMPTRKPKPAAGAESPAG